MVKKAKGYWGKRSKIYRRAKETVNRAMQFATRDRKNRKRDFRRLWITRIHAACSNLGIPYSRFMAGLKSANVTLDRKILADLAVSDSAAFEKLVQTAREAQKQPVAA
jgi:large subunit ribosomal protein L20